MKITMKNWKRVGVAAGVAALCLGSTGCKKDEAAEGAEGAAEQQAAPASTGIVLTGTVSTTTERTGNVGAVQSASDRFPNCAGNVPAEPQHTFRVNGTAEARVVARGAADLVMVITGPGGPYCNDDFEGLNPGFQRTFTEGDYQVYVGTWSSSQQTDDSYTLAFGAPQAAAEMPGDLGAALQQLGQLGGQLGAEGQQGIEALGAALGEAFGQALGGGMAGDGATLNVDVPAREGTVTRDAGTPASTMNVTAGGSANAQSANVGCFGRVNPQGPSVSLIYTPNQQSLLIRARAEDDTTLAVRDPAGNWLCNDDFEGELNAGVLIGSPAAGTYQIWAGRFGFDDTVIPATLEISER